MFTHLNNVALLAPGCGKRQDAHIRNFVLFRSVQLQIVRQTDVAVVSPVTSWWDRAGGVVVDVVCKWCAKNKHIKDKLVDINFSAAILLVDCIRPTKCSGWVNRKCNRIIYGGEQSYSI